MFRLINSGIRAASKSFDQEKQSHADAEHYGTEISTEDFPRGEERIVNPGVVVPECHDRRERRRHYIGFNFAKLDEQLPG